MEAKKDYENYRWFFTSSGKLVVGGKSEEQNEMIMNVFKKPNYVVAHTTEPGSPFMIIQDNHPTKDDIKEAAIFTACFSQQWKKMKKNISVDIFKGSEIYKTVDMKLGTFGVNKKIYTLKVNPLLFLVVQRGKIKAVPSFGKEQSLVKIKPGNLSKEKAAEQISKMLKEKFRLLFTKQEIMQAIPSDKISII
ncbi:MAG: NFACT RNA binding domain-containing protein [Candidatus Nanoarchaeia archaeon]